MSNHFFLKNSLIFATFLLLMALFSSCSEDLNIGSSSSDYASVKIRDSDDNRLDLPKSEEQDATVSVAKFQTVIEKVDHSSPVEVSSPEMVRVRLWQVDQPAKVEAVYIASNKMIALDEKNRVYVLAEDADASTVSAEKSFFMYPYNGFSEQMAEVTAESDHFIYPLELKMKSSWISSKKEMISQINTSATGIERYTVDAHEDLFAANGLNQARFVSESDICFSSPGKIQCAHKGVKSSGLSRNLIDLDLKDDVRAAYFDAEQDRLTLLTGQTEVWFLAKKFDFLTEDKSLDESTLRRVSLSLSEFLDTSRLDSLKKAQAIFILDSNFDGQRLDLGFALVDAGTKGSAQTISLDKSVLMSLKLESISQKQIEKQLEEDKDLNTGGGASPPSRDDKLKAEFEQTILPVADRNCTSCHGENAAAASLNLTRYDSWKLNALQIRKSVETGSMPQNAAITDADKKSILEYVDSLQIEYIELFDL